MKIPCPNCGGTVVVKGLGRKSLNISVKNVCDVLQVHHSIPAAAIALGCSRALIYKTLHDNGLSIKDILPGSGKR